MSNGLQRLRWTASSAEKILGDIASSPANRRMLPSDPRLMKLLAEEETKFKLELRHGGAPPEER